MSFSVSLRTPGIEGDKGEMGEPGVEVNMKQQQGDHMIQEVQHFEPYVPRSSFYVRLMSFP